MTTARVQHTRSALAHAWSPHAWRDVLAVRPADAAIVPALRVAVAMLVTLCVGGLVGQQQLAAIATLGSLCSAFCRYEAYPYLARRLVLVGLLLVASTAVGGGLGAVEAPIGVQVGVLAVLGAVALVVLTAFRILGPGPVIMMFAASAGAGFADSAADVGRVTLATGLGVAVGAACCLVGALWLPLGPARLAVARALGALDRHAPGASVEPVRQAIAAARTTVAWSPAGPRTDPRRRVLWALLDQAEQVLATDGLAGRQRLTRHEPALRRLWPIPLDTEHLDADLLAHADQLGTPARTPGLLAQSLHRLLDAELLRGSVRVLAGAALAGLLAVDLGLAHPLWAGMGAMAALQGLTYHSTLQRGVQRLSGNVVGGLVAAGLLALDLGYWPLAAIAVLLQLLVELMVARSYLLVQVGVTPMALLLASLGSPFGPSMALDRVGDTLVGVLVGAVVGVATISLADHHHLQVRHQ